MGLPHSGSLSGRPPRKTAMPKDQAGCPACPRKTAMSKDQPALPSLGVSHSGCMSIPGLRQMTNDGKRKSFSRFPSSSGNIHVSILFHQNMPHSLNHVRDRQIRELRNKNRKKGYSFPLFRFNRFYFTPPILFCQYFFSCYTNFW